MLNLNPRFGNNFLDANVLDQTSQAEDAIVDRILAFAMDRAFTLLLP